MISVKGTPELPDGSANQYRNATPVQTNDIYLGDLVFFKADPSRTGPTDHVAMVSGNVERDENGNVVSFSVVQSSGGDRGWNETKVTIGTGTP